MTHPVKNVPLASSDEWLSKSFCKTSSNGSAAFLDVTKWLHQKT